MRETYKISDDEIIAYQHHKSKKNLPCVVFLHGLMSDMQGSKSQYLYNYCCSKDIPFLAFDNLGCGKSSGNYIDQTMGKWLDSAKKMIRALTENGAIIVGSSAGAWTALSLAMSMKDLVKGLICIAAAPDFTEDMWESLPPQHQERLHSGEVLDIQGYPLSYNFIEEGRNHLLLNKEIIPIDCPVHFLHGVKDTVVSHNLSMQLFDKISSKRAVLKLIKDGDHRLSRPEDLTAISNSLDEILQINMQYQIPD
ncbi:MAG: alpha/beta hydrolase [Pseudomonadota bacterium]